MTVKRPPCSIASLPVAMNSSLRAADFAVAERSALHAPAQLGVLRVPRFVGCFVVENDCSDHARRV
jgi:hypothetical protein